MNNQIGTVIKVLDDKYFIEFDSEYGMNVPESYIHVIPTEKPSKILKLRSSPPLIQTHPTIKLCVIICNLKH